MNKFLSIAITIVFLAAAVIAQKTKKEDQPSPGSKYPLTAVLVVAPEQCGEKLKRHHEKFKVGEELCLAVAEVAKQTFQDVKQVEAVPKKGDDPSKIVLSFKSVDVDATSTATAFGKRTAVLLVEWTATDSAGKVFWVQTIEGKTKERAGNLFTAKGHKRKMIEDVCENLLENSVTAIRQSPEFQKVAQKAASKDVTQ